MRALVAVAAAASVLALAACGSARRSEPLTGPLPLSAQEMRGERLFMAECHQCHPGGEAGLGPALNDKPLPGFLITTQVRLGAGAMPRFSAHELTSQEVDDVVAYLKARRRHG